MVGSTLDPQDFVRANVGLPLTTAGLARSVEQLDGGCWSVEIDPRLTCPSGRPVRPADLIAAWERALGAGEPAHVAMLDPVAGAAEVIAGRSDRATGLRELDGRLLVCTEAPAPDLRQRLAHPGLWQFCETAPAEGRLDGPGLFRQPEPGVLLPVHRQEVPGPALESVVLVPDDGMPSLLLRLGEVDVGVLLGEEAEALREGEIDTLIFEPLPRWDRLYYLWFDSSRRWANDPRFRSWVAGLIDRDAIVEVVLGGAGEPVRRLLVDGPSAPARGRPLEADASRPFAPSSRPRIDLSFDGGDPRAKSLAARLKAVLDLNGVALALEPRPSAVAVGRLGEGAVLELRTHLPASDDPVLALLEGLQGLPAVPERTFLALRGAAREARPDLRLRAARVAEDELIEDGRLLPLVRVRAWLAIDRDLRGVRTGGPGVLLLEDVWWQR